MRAVGGRSASRPMPKRRKSPAVPPGQRKLTGVASLGASAHVTPRAGSRFAACPICAKNFPRHALLTHAGGCLGEPSPTPSTSAPTQPPPSNDPTRRPAARLRSTSGPVARVRIGGPDASWMPCAVESLREMVPDLPFVLVERVMPPRDADALLEDLRAEATTWGQDEWWIAGEARKAPRLTAVYEMRVEDARAEALRMAGLDDDDDDAEDGGGSERVPPPGMRVAAERASAAVTAALRSVPSRHLPDDMLESVDDDSYEWAPTYAVANFYRDGSDRVGPHADQLTSLGPLPAIAGLSLGATRSFRLRKRWPGRPGEDASDRSGDVWVDVPLPHNSLAVMLPPCQELWTHEIVREGGGDGKARVSLTFRRKARDWVDRAPTCECGRRCVLKTRRGDAPAPAFALNTDSDGVMDAEDGKTPVMYYYTCDPVNGGKPCKFYKPVKVVAL